MIDETDAAVFREFMRRKYFDMQIAEFAKPEKDRRWISRTSIAGIAKAAKVSIAIYWCEAP